jgi:Holliday junction resolvase RusA-like endonuclease
VNDSYVGKGGRFLSKKAKRFKLQAQLLLSKQLAAQPDAKVDRYCGYEIHVVFVVPDLYVAGWPKKAKYRYKKWDADNHAKALFDVICATLDIDDSQFLSINLRKRDGQEEETIIALVVIEEAPHATGGRPRSRARGTQPHGKTGAGQVATPARTPKQPAARPAAGRGRTPRPPEPR